MFNASLRNKTSNQIAITVLELTLEVVGNVSNGLAHQITGANVNNTSTPVVHNTHHEVTKATTEAGSNTLDLNYRTKIFRRNKLLCHRKRSSNNNNISKHQQTQSAYSAVITSNTDRTVESARGTGA